jgi:hypothetical protein
MNAPPNMAPILPFGDKREKVDVDWLADALRLRPNTPAGKSGDIRVDVEVKPAGERVDVVSWRNATMMGQQRTCTILDVDTPFRYLRSTKHGTWMSDVPQEIYQAREPIEHIRGLDGSSVLVGGLGLGCYSRFALMMGRANYVATVEISKHVSKLVAPHVAAPRHEIVLADIHQYAAKLHRGKFDAAILDTWQSTGEYCWTHEVIPLRRLVRPKVPYVHCWCEREMVGQFLMAAYRRIMIPAKQTPRSDPHYRAIRLAAEAEGIIDPKFNIIELAGTLERWLVEESKIRCSQRVVELVHAFTHDPGSPEWEQRFGQHWDRACRMRDPIIRKKKPAKATT